MARNDNVQEKRKAANEAKKAGTTASKVGASTGADKQISTTPGSKREPAGDRKS